MIKKHIKKLKFIFLFSLVFLLSACRIKGTDTINVDKNFKGNRTIEINLDSETLGKVNGGKDAVKKFLGKYIEKPLTYKITKDKNDDFDDFM